MNGQVVCYLYSISQCEEPELLGEEVFGHVVSGDVVDVLLIGFRESVLVLSFRWGVGNLCCGVEVVGYNATN